MPAGRRIIVQVQGEGFRDPDLQGEYVPGEVVDYPVWARRRDVSQENKIQGGGADDATHRDWRIRWHPLFFDTPLSRLKVTDGLDVFTVINLVEVTEQRGGAPDLRRRWIDITGSHSSRNPQPTIYPVTVAFPGEGGSITAAVTIRLAP